MNLFGSILAGRYLLAGAEALAVCLARAAELMVALSLGMELF
jgi:hypothetical protein